MTDDERRSFANLILLCKPHHDLIDKLRPEEYPVDTLERWKVEREGAESGMLASVSEDRLEEMILEAVRETAPRRDVRVELGGGILLDGEAISFPLEVWRTLLEANPHLTAMDQVLVTTVRNVGGLRASVESVSVFLGVSTGDFEAPFTLMGRDDYPALNPGYPDRSIRVTR